MRLCVPVAVTIVDAVPARIASSPAVQVTPDQIEVSLQPALPPFHVSVAAAALEPEMESPAAMSNVRSETRFFIQ